MTDRVELTHLAWIDAESTGLDKHRDPILEIAMIVTDMDLVTQKKFTTVVNPGPGLLKARLELNPYVKEMHTKNGLLEEIEAGRGCSVNEAEARMISVLAAHACPGGVMIAGSGVGHYDKPMLQLQMPLLSEWFFYRPLDIGNVRSFIKYVLKRKDLLLPETESPHRALPDITQALSEARYYRDCIGEVPVKALDEEG